MDSDEGRRGAMAGESIRDDLLDEARRACISHGRASVSFLQRHLRIGYTRAGWLIDDLEAEGTVSKPDKYGMRVLTTEAPR